MKPAATVKIIGVPMMCSGELKDSWREVANWAAGQLAHRFGKAVQVRYYNLFDQDCPLLPENARLPLVLVNNEILSMGGKISVPAIRKKLGALGITPQTRQ